MDNLGVEMDDTITSAHVLENKMRVYLQHIKLAVVALSVLVAALIIILGIITVKIVFFL